MGGILGGVVSLLLAMMVAAIVGWAVDRTHRKR
jgi:hypothetical protein